MSTVSRGSSAENAVARYQRAHGWLVGSMRHMRGGGDLLCVHTVSGVVWLLEIKHTSRKYLWQRFDRSQRQEMLDTILPPGGQRFVVRVENVKKEEFEWIDERRWPKLPASVADSAEQEDDDHDEQDQPEHQSPLPL